ncbi:MAG: helix-turn-helix domain-containing protein [Candidatus Limnocylindrales bacterium]
MEDIRVGAAFRAVRLRRRWRQVDVASKAGVPRSLVSDIERGHFSRTSLDRFRAVAAALGIRVDLVACWRGDELARLLNAYHSAMHESVARFLEPLPGWRFVPEVSFSISGERGVIDILAFHPSSGSLLVIELKTKIVDVNELVGTLDRKTRLARRIAADRGWHAESVSRWVIIARDRTNQRRIEAHRTMLRAALPADGHAMRRWMASPSAAISGLSMWTDVALTDAGRARSQRVRLTSGLDDRR